MKAYDPRWPGEAVTGTQVVGETLRGRTRLLGRRAAIGWILAGAVLLRVALFFALGDLPLRGDEVEYQAIAVNLVEGRGFALNDRLTSWRPPLYPFALAAVYVATGSADPRAMHLVQIALSAATILLVYLLGRRLFGESRGLLAAALLAVYPSLLFYTVHLLTETLFAFLVTLTLYCFALHVGRPRLLSAAATGLCLGLAALGRDVILPLALPLALLMMVKPARPGWGRAAGHAAACLLAVGAVVGPWIARNTALNGTFTSISTNGGPAILAGNNPHTPVDRPWKYHDFEREQRWRSLVPGDVTEGQRQRIAVSLALEYMREHPGLTVRRALVKAANVWGLERDIVGTMLAGQYGQVRPLTVILLTAAIFGAYGAALLAGIAGLACAMRDGADRGFHLLVLCLAVLVTAVHAVAFGHPRYHLPLMPVVWVYAAHAWMRRGAIWRERRSPAFLVAGALAAVVVAIWAREIFLVEFARFAGALKHL